ncbi:TetR family transcriptional regulator [Halomonas sp. CS7]|uniref:TetR family transcriptional regulator n=1 Tax=Halomonas pelophila TaxID=3151122 RepID=A0ABV1N6P2_9GAMM
MARKTKAKAAETREALLDAAEEVFFEHGVQQASLERVACQAGMTRGAVYWHFRNKSDLFRAVLERARVPVHELIASSERDDHGEDPIARLKALFEQGLERLDTPRHHRVHATLVYRCEARQDLDPAGIHDEMAGEFHAALLAFFVRVERRGGLRPDVSAEDVTRIVFSTVSGIYHNWLNRSGTFSLRRDGMQTLSTLLDLVAAQGPDTTGLGLAGEGRISIAT